MRLKHKPRTILVIKPILALVGLIGSVAVMLERPQVSNLILPNANNILALFLIDLFLGLSLWLTIWHFGRRVPSSLTLQFTDIDRMNGIAFERYVARLLEQRGFRVQTTPATGDLGVDLIAEKETLRCSVQVKRQRAPVSRRAVSDAVAGKNPYQCNTAVVITNGFFTPGAKELARATKCELVDRIDLNRWIKDWQAEDGFGNRTKESGRNDGGNSTLSTSFIPHLPTVVRGRCKNEAN